MIDAIQISAWLDQWEAVQPQAAEWETADSQLTSPGKKLRAEKNSCYVSTFTFYKYKLTYTYTSKHQIFSQASPGKKPILRNPCYVSTYTFYKYKLTLTYSTFFPGESWEKAESWEKLLFFVNLYFL